jgi:hypothetical protein
MSSSEQSPKNLMDCEVLVRELGQRKERELRKTDNEPVNIVLKYFQKRHAVDTAIIEQRLGICRYGNM